MPEVNEKRSGEDRRNVEVSHLALFEKLMDHEQKITRAEGKIDNIGKDVHVIKEEIQPIARGVNSMVLLFKIAIAVGVLTTAIMGVTEISELLQHTHD